MNALTKLDTRHQTKTGLLVVGLAELAMAYVFASWAIDSGRLLAWFFTIILVVGALQNLVKLIWKTVLYGRKV